MGKHIVTNGFVKNYTQWICHGEAHHVREEVVRKRIDDYDADAGCGDMLAEFHEAHFEEGLGKNRQSQPQSSITTYCLRHKNHFTSIPMLLNWMPLHAYWP